MNEHKLFYYPYASFTDTQLPLLKVAAVWFDKLVLLDPLCASWNTIGADAHVRDAVGMLKKEGILELVTPAEVLAKYESAITAGIQQDMYDRAFLQLCEEHARTTGKQHWSLALAKVPQEVQTDQKMRYLMGDFARELAGTSALVYEEVGGDRGNYDEYAKTGQAYDEYREYADAVVEYRFASFPLALGEAIMMNHALFAGLLHAEATPITDDPFHNRALNHKLQNAMTQPDILEIINERARKRGIKEEQLVYSALTDSDLELPVLNPKLPLEEVLEFREKHEDALRWAREELGRMARRIQAEPWSQEFARELEHETIPNIIEKLDEAKRARDDWLQSKKNFYLDVLKIGAIGAAVVLSASVNPLTPVALATAGLILASGTAIPGIQSLLDLLNKKKVMQENGLHYLLKMQQLAKQG